jgi:nickel transport protein
VTIVLVALLLVGGRPAFAHRMGHAVSTGEALVVTLSYPFGAPPMFEPYRIYAPDADVAFQTGRTDRLGRVSFLPDRPGDWRIVIATEDGHGAEMSVVVDDGGGVIEPPSAGPGGMARTIAGVGYLFGVAGAVVLWRNRRRSARSLDADRRFD